MQYPNTGHGEFERLVPKIVDNKARAEKNEGGTGLDGLTSPKMVPPGKDAFINRLNQGGAGNTEEDDFFNYDNDEDKERDDLSDNLTSAASSRATTPTTASASSEIPSSTTTANFAPPKRTKFEDDALRRAQDRQKAGLMEGQPQVAGGRTFSGQAFASKPDVILFKDFVVGKVYRKKILLTNVSLTFNR